VPSCAEGGVLGVLPGLIGVIQATETLKLLLGIGETLIGRLLLVDALRMQFRTLSLARDPECPACGTHELRELIDYEEFCGERSAATAAAASATMNGELTPSELAERRARGDDFDLIDVREPHEWEIARIEGARLVPLSSLEGALSTIDPDREIVVYCKTGGRSARAVRTLHNAGYRRVRNLTGGISRWSDEVDPSVPKY
jgi:adenylyltransferase/sulfurtransferase